MNGNFALLLLFLITFTLTNSQLSIDPIPLLQLFFDLQFSELDTTIYHYKNVGEKKQYNKYECYNQLKILKDELKNGEFWAIKGEAYIVNILKFYLKLSRKCVKNLIFLSRQLLMLGVKYQLVY